MSQNKTKTTIALIITLISVIVLAVTSYAWMTLSSSPVVSDLAFSLVTENALEIAPDVDGTPGEWSSILDLTDPSKQASLLKPLTLSTKEIAFSFPGVGEDGRTNGVLKSIRLADQLSTARTSSATADTEDDLSNYLFMYTFYMKTKSTDCTISLMKPETEKESEKLESNGCFVIGAPVWDQDTQRHYDQGRGAENALRIGFYIEAMDEGEEDVFIVYEPNCDAGYDAFGDNVEYGGQYKILRQKTSTFTETDPVLADSVIYKQGEFEDDDTDLFYLKAGTERRITIVIWIEGEDADCTMKISSGQIMVNLQFVGSEDHGDTPIYPD